MKVAADNLVPVSMELGGKSPLIFCKSVMDHDDAFLDKAIEGAVLFALNQGEVCTCPSRFLVVSAECCLSVCLSFCLSFFLTLD